MTTNSTPSSMPRIRPRRSALYTPGSNLAVLRKALQSAADVLIFDLEDAVAPENKVAARHTVTQVLAECSGQREVVVRVNAIGSPWCNDDVQTMARAGATAFLFPKIASEHEVKVADAMLSFYGIPRHTELWCMIETPLAILNAHEIARCATRPNTRMKAWVIGTNDLVKEMHGQHVPSREPLLPALAFAVLAARAYGLCVLDGVHNDIQDVDGLEASCRQGRALGFDGKTLIHPSQIAPCHRSYSPSVDEVRDAREILAAFALPEHQGKGVIKLGGRMVELLHAEIAQQTVAIADAIEASDSA